MQRARVSLSIGFHRPEGPQNSPLPNSERGPGSQAGQSYHPGSNDPMTGGEGREGAEESRRGKENEGGGREKKDKRL